MSDSFNILLSSAGRRVALVGILRRTLADLGLTGQVVASDMSPVAAAYQAADRRHLVPRCSGPDFIPRTLEICRQEQVRLLIPTIDTELPVLAAHREAFADIGTTVMVSGPGTVAIANRKDATHRWLTEQGLPTVRQTDVEGVLADPRSWPFPLFAKPTGGSRSIGAGRVDSIEELRALAGDGDYIVQSLARGIEYTVDALIDRSGRCVCAVPRRRLEVRSGEVSKGMTVRNEAIIAEVVRVCEALPDAYGTVCVQVFFDQPTGEVTVIEINPRFGGGFPLTWESGAHFPRWLIEELLGRPGGASHGSWKHGLVMLRYDEAVFADAATLGLEAV